MVAGRNRGKEGSGVVRLGNRVGVVAVVVGRGSGNKAEEANEVRGGM